MAEEHFLTRGSHRHCRARRLGVARSRPAYVGAESLIGAIGKVREPLAPQGMVFVAGALWRASAAGGRIPTGSEVRVVARQGLELDVVPLEAPAPVVGQPRPSNSEQSPRIEERIEGT
ncbi:MAG TPA: NfeD family protein [Candidatus Dormibacteraeota bacterium]